MNRRKFLKYTLGIFVTTILPLQWLSINVSEADALNKVLLVNNGDVLDVESLEDALNVAMNNFGQPTQLYMSSETYRDFKKCLGTQTF